MDLSKIRKFDDNTLFRFLSKSYGKNKPLLDSQKLGFENNSQRLFSSSLKKPKARSQSSSIHDTISTSQYIGQKSLVSRPGFLKHRNFSVIQTFPLNSRISAQRTPNRYSLDLKTSDQKSYKQLKRTIDDYELKKQTKSSFGLRNVVKGLQSQFKSEDNQFSTISQQLTSQVLLCSKNHKMFGGRKQYNMNGFIITQNVINFRKYKRNTLKTSLLSRKLQNSNRKQTHLSLD